MPKPPRPEPMTTRLETHGPDGVVIARMEFHPDATTWSKSEPTWWTLTVAPGNDELKAALGLAVRDGRYATKALTATDARRTLDYATHVVLNAVEAMDQARTLLAKGLDRAVALSSQETLPLEEGGTHG